MLVSFQTPLQPSKVVLQGLQDTTGSNHAEFSSLSYYSVITTPELLRNFHSDGETHGKPKYSNLGWYVGQVLGSCVGLLEGADWKKNRKIFDPAFTHAATVSHIHVTNSTAKAFVDNLPSTVTTTATITDGDADDGPGNKKDEGPNRTLKFPIVSGFQKYPFLLTAALIYGPMSSTEEDNLWTMAEKRLALTPYLFIGGPYRYKRGNWFDRKAFGQLNDFKNEWIKYNRDIVEDRRSQGIKTPILSYWDAYQSGQITMDNVSGITKHLNRQKGL